MFKIKIDHTSVRESASIFWWLLKLCFRTKALESTLYLIGAAIQTGLGIFSYYAAAKITVLLIAVVSGSQSARIVWIWFGMLIASSLISNLSYRINETIERRLYFKLTHWSALTFAKHLTVIDLASFYDSETRNMITRLNQGVAWQLPNAAYFSLAICQSILNTLVTVVTVGLAVWWFVPVFIILLIPMLIHESRLSGIGWFVFTQEGEGQHIFWGIMTTFLETKKQFEIRALGASKRLLKILDELTTKFYRLQVNEVKKTNRLAVASLISQLIREGVSQAWLLFRVLHKSLSVESYLFNVSLIFRLDGALSGLFRMLAQFNIGAKFAIEYRKFIDIEPSITDLLDAEILENEPPSIEFIGVSFKYPGSKAYVFKDLSFSINAGEKIAIVGENGAGKSTIINLLLRFYSLNSGEIRINGRNIQHIQIDSLLSQLAILFQDFNHYTLTAKDNIAISDDKVDMTRVKNAAQLSGAFDLIEKLPLKFDTYLNPSLKDGVELSGGQWQKIALARAFYREANLMILDEPTSAIDAKAEHEIFNNIFEKHDGKTLLIISHRFSTVRKADKIIVLEAGKIVESGTHKQLLAMGGIYTDMFNKQAEGYR